METGSRRFGMCQAAVIDGYVGWLMLEGLSSSATSLFSVTLGL